jgi:hypothetical protein
MRHWDRATQSIYANLLDSVKCEAGAPASGSIVRSISKGREYIQHRVTYEGKQISLNTSKDAHRESWPERRRLVATLLAFGVNAPDRPAARTFELLDAIGCFSAQKAVLVGSHAFAAIGNNLGVTWDAGFETKDIDLGRSIRVSCEPSNRTSEVLLKAGFREVFSVDHKQPATTYVHANGMKVDFLTPMTGKPSGKPALLLGAGVYAEPLRFLDYLIQDPQQAVVMTRNGILASVPQSARFAFHKCIICQYRQDDVKRSKDILQAESILDVLEEGMPQLISDAWEALPWKDKAFQGMRNFGNRDLVSRLGEIIPLSGKE